MFLKKSIVKEFTADDEFKTSLISFLFPDKKNTEIQIYVRYKKMYKNPKIILNFDNKKV